LLCVCVYRCVQLKDLSVVKCDSVTDAGIKMVISNCIQLTMLNLRGLINITGMCAVCEVPEPTLCFITLCYMIYLQIITDDKAHH
jgi:bacterioferritin-associated ferredoxin